MLSRYPKYFALLYKPQLLFLDYIILVDLKSFLMVKPTTILWKLLLLGTICMQVSKAQSDDYQPDNILGTYMDMESGLATIVQKSSPTTYLVMLKDSTGKQYFLQPATVLSTNSRMAWTMHTKEQNPPHRKAEITFAVKGVEPFSHIDFEGGETAGGMMITSSADYDITLWSVASLILSGVFVDPSTNELLVIEPWDKDIKVYYSNGKQPFSQIIAKILDKNKFKFTVQFSEIGELYRVTGNPVPWDAWVEIENPDGTKQSFYRINSCMNHKVAPQSALEEAKKTFGDR
jgi:hypothetical protein